MNYFTILQVSKLIIRKCLEGRKELHGGGSGRGREKITAVEPLGYPVDISGQPGAAGRSRVRKTVLANVQSGWKADT